MRTVSPAKTHEEVLAEVEPSKRSDIQRLYDLIVKAAPDFERFTISGIMGFGRYHYRYASGREGDWFHFGLVANKTGFSVYVCASDGNGCLAEQAKGELGKAIVGKSCIRFKRLSDLNLDALERLVVKAKGFCE